MAKETRKTSAKSGGTGQKAKSGTAGTKTAAKPAAKKPAVKAASKKSKAAFKLDAPYATRVYVAGCFNGWDATANPLDRDDDGLWSCTLSMEPGKHEYRFVVDGVWCDDPVNSMRCCNELGTENCLIIV